MSAVIFGPYFVELFQEGFFIKLKKAELEKSPRFIDWVEK